MRLNLSVRAVAQPSRLRVPAPSRCDDDAGGETPPHSQAGTPALRLTLLIALGTKLASIRTTLFCAIAARLGSSFLAERCGKAQPQHVGKRRRDGRIRKLRACQPAATGPLRTQSRSGSSANPVATNLFPTAANPVVWFGLVIRLRNKTGSNDPNLVVLPVAIGCLNYLEQFRDWNRGPKLML